MIEVEAVETTNEPLRTSKKLSSFSSSLRSMSLKHKGLYLLFIAIFAKPETRARSHLKVWHINREMGDVDG